MLYGYKDGKLLHKCDECGHNFSNDVSEIVVSKIDELNSYPSLNLVCEKCGTITCYNMDFSQEIYEKEKHTVIDAENQQRQFLLRVIRAKREDFVNERKARGIES